jgi:hypothetical protein
MPSYPDNEQRRITRTEALKLAQEILERAERERLQSADLEASHSDDLGDKRGETSQ